MDAHRVERPHVELEQRVAFALGEVIAFCELGRRLEIGLPALRPAVHVADQLLQRIETHEYSVRDVFAILATAPVNRKPVPTTTVQGRRSCTRTCSTAASGNSSRRSE